MMRSAPLKRKVPLRANGGKARAEQLSPERRSEIARAGGMARSAKRGPEGQPLCSRCGAEHDRASKSGKPKSYCQACSNAVAAEWRKANPLEGEAKVKANARSYAKVYLSRGLIQNAPCEKCGDEKSEMHHDDYSKPTEVRWLCRACHLAHHRIVERGTSDDRPRAVMAANIGAEPSRQVAKDGVYRSELWRRAVAALPCVFCGAPSQAAHRNAGKGMGIKTDDSLTAAICPAHHAEIDQGNDMTREQRRARLDEAIVLTVRELARAGKLKVAA